MPRSLFELRAHRPTWLAKSVGAGCGGARLSLDRVRSIVSLLSSGEEQMSEHEGSQDGHGAVDADQELARQYRDDWFTRQLGEGWVAGGDGIYYPPGAAPPRVAGRPRRGARRGAAGRASTGGGDGRAARGTRGPAAQGPLAAPALGIDALIRGAQAAPGGLLPESLPADEATAVTAVPLIRSDVKTLRLATPSCVARRRRGDGVRRADGRRDRDLAVRAPARAARVPQRLIASRSARNSRLTVSLLTRPRHRCPPAARGRHIDDRRPRPGRDDLSDRRPDGLPAVHLLEPDPERRDRFRVVPWHPEDLVAAGGGRRGVQ